MLQQQKMSVPEKVSASDREKAIDARAALAQQVINKKISIEQAKASFDRDYPSGNYGVEFPSVATPEQLRALATVKVAPTQESGYEVGQNVTGEKIQQEKIATKKAAADLIPAQFDASQYNMDNDGLYFQGIPKPLEGYVDKLEKDYRLVTRELSGNVRDAEYASSELARLTNNFTKNLSGFEAVAAVFRAMKSLDPTSTVRESEYQAAANAGGWFQTAMAAFDKFKDGTTLPSVVVKQMADVAKASIPKYESALREIQAEAAEKSAMRKINPSYVMGGRDAADYMSKGTPIKTSTVPAGWERAK